MLKNMLLPRLMSLNSLNFDFMECSFNDKMMACKDKKDGLSREGSGRVAIMRACNGLPNCYTLECNYASGRCMNHISAKLNKATQQNEPEIAVTDPKSRVYAECHGKDNKKNKAPSYTIEIFEDIGRAFCIGLLDFYGVNPITRIPTSIYKSIEGVKDDILARNPIFIPKPKKEEEEKPTTAWGRRQPRGLVRQQTNKSTAPPLQKARANVGSAIMSNSKSVGSQMNSQTQMKKLTKGLSQAPKIIGPLRESED